MAQLVHMRSPNGDEIREVEATPEALSPLMSRGWNQVPAPADHQSIVASEEK